MLNMLRFISNDLKASLVCFGVMEGAKPYKATCNWRAGSMS